MPRSAFPPVSVLCCAVFAGALGGCGPPPDVTTEAAIRFDPCAPVVLVSEEELSPAVVAGVEAGVDFWNRSAHARLSFAGGLAPPLAGEAATIPLRFQAAGAPFHGLYDPEVAQIFINTDLTGHDEAIAIAHEVGHAFGLVHVAPELRRSVMNAGNLDQEPNANDVADLTAIWGACPQAP